MLILRLSLALLVDSIFIVYIKQIDYFCKPNELHMNTRLLRFLEAENISQSQFADSIGVARASISHILSGRNKPGFDFLEKLASQYPNLSLEWLVTGRGRMYNAGGEDAESLENALPLAPKGQIERIVVFFSDGTFKEFK